MPIVSELEANIRRQGNVYIYIFKQGTFPFKRTNILIDQKINI